MIRAVNCRQRLPFGKRLKRHSIRALRRLRFGLLSREARLRVSADFHTQARYFGPLALALEHLGKSERNAILTDYERILKGDFNLLQLVVNLPLRKLNWSQDVSSGYCWGHAFYAKLRTIDLTNTSDVKYVYELSRMQHLIPLALGKCLADDEKAWLLFKEQLESWWKQNPLDGSINWTSAMEVALRAISLLLAGELFQEDLDRDLSFRNRFYSSLLDHGDYIHNNLEYSPNPNNHLISNYLGLFMLGLCFRTMRGSSKKRAETWLRTGVAGLSTALKEQVAPDGLSHEGSTHYHRLNLEFFLLATCVARRNKVQLSERWDNTLRSMCRALLLCITPSQQLPAIGDCDNGRVLILDHYFDWHFESCDWVLDLSAALFPDCFPGSRAPSLYSQLLCPQDLVESRDRKHLPEPALSILPQSGLIRLQHKQWWALLRGGYLLERAPTGHYHNDQSSLCLYHGDTAILVDPGMETYTGDASERNRLRSTSMHSVFCCEDLEQVPLSDLELFRYPLRNNTESVMIGKASARVDIHDYFPGSNVNVSREVRLESDAVIIDTRATGEFLHGRQGRLVHILAPGIQPVEIRGGTLRLAMDNSAAKTLLCEFPPELGAHWESVDISRGYGARQRATRLELSWTCGADNRIRVIFRDERAG